MNLALEALKERGGTGLGGGAPGRVEGERADTRSDASLFGGERRAGHDARFGGAEA